MTSGITDVREPVAQEELHEPDPAGDFGIVRLLGALEDGVVIFEPALAKLFDRHPVSVKRAVDRGELPAPCRMFGGNAWTAGSIRRHIEERLARAAKEKDQLERRLATLAP